MRLTSLFSASKKNVLTLALGTFLSQLFGFLLLPLLSRIYDPYQFGVFYTFIGISQTLGLVSTLKFEKSIILPSDNEEGNDLVNLTISVILIFCLLLSVVLLFFNFLDFPFVNPKEYIYLLPITVFGYSLLNVFIQNFQRNKRFIQISVFGVIQSISVILLSVIFSYFHNLKSGLILGYVFGNFVSVIVLLIYDYKNTINVFRAFNVNNLKSNIIKYIDFPKYYLLYDILVSGTIFLIPVIITNYYSEIECGMYSMTYRILMVPIIIVSIAISNVFLVRAKENFIENNNFKQLYKETFYKIAIMSLLVYLPTFFFGGKLITIFLGDNWSGIEMYVKIISSMLFFEFISYVFKNNTFIIVQKQKVGLRIQIFNILLSVGSLIFLSKYSLINALLVYSLISILFSCINVFITYNLSKGTLKKIIVD